MADKTKIEWADATLNYVNGCSLESPGCTNCYAMKQAHRFPVRQGLTVKTKRGMVWTGEVRPNPRALEQALAWTKPRAIFWNAHGDLFHPSVPDEWIDRQFAVMALTPQHRHMVLTKRSARMRQYVTGLRDRPRRLQLNEFEFVWSPFEGGVPKNIWLGVSVEDQQRADERIPDLLATPAAVRFISAEPLLGPVDLKRVFLGEGGFDPAADAGPEWRAIKTLRFTVDALVGAPSIGWGPLNWVIVGGESGPGARPMHPEWVISLRDQCEAAGVAFHFKQWGEYLPVYVDNITSAGHEFRKVGKKAAGRRLHGVEHNGVPC